MFTAPVDDGDLDLANLLRGLVVEEKGEPRLVSARRRHLRGTADKE